MAAVGSRRTAAVGLLVTSYVQAGLALVKGFLFIPLYLRHFDLATYGGYLASANVVGILGVLDVGISTAFYQRLAFVHGRGSKGEFARLAGAGFTVLGVTALVIGAIGWLISSYVPGWINVPSSSAVAITHAFRLAVIGSAAMILNQGIHAVPGAWQISSIPAASRISAQLAEMCATVSSLFAGWGVVSLGIGSLVGAALGLFVTLVLVLRRWRRDQFPIPRPDGASFRWLLSVGVPTLLSRVVGQIVGNMEVALISLFAGPALAAVYGITERTFRLAQGFINPIIGSAFSGLSHLMGESGPNAFLTPLRELRGLFTLVVAVVLPSILVINQDFVTLWVGTEKYGGTILSIALTLSALLSTQCFFLGIIATAVGQVQRTAYLNTVEAVVRVPLVVAGLRIYGPAGMVFAASIGSALFVFIAYPSVIGRGLGLAPSQARTIGNNGIGVALTTVILAGLSACLVPAATRWSLLVAKGIVTAVVLLGIALLLDKAARIQMRTTTMRLLKRFRQ